MPYSARIIMLIGFSSFHIKVGVQKYCRNCLIAHIVGFNFNFNLLLLFRSNFDANPPPILIDNGMAVLENEKIERHIMKNVPGGYNLFVQDKEVATLIENLYSVS